MKRRFVVVLAAMSAIVAACQVLAGIGYVDKDTLATNPQPEGGTSPDGAPVIPDPCNHVRPEPEPETDDGREEIAPFYLALRAAYVGPRDGGVAGFDLDGVCTCDKRPNTHADGGSTCTPKKPNADCDPAGGVDNQGSALFQQLEVAKVNIDEESDVNTSIADGKGGLLIYISGYNGKDNDKEVFAGAMRSYGIVDGSGCGTDVGNTPGKYRPGWCGSDLWTYSNDLVKSGTKVPTTQAKGYVRNKMLVFENDIATLFFGGSTVDFVSPITAGKLEKIDGKWTFKGTMSGRIGTTSLLRAVGSFGDPFDKSPLPDGGRRPFCNWPGFDAIRASVCDAVDISSSKSYDLTGGPCDAISSAVAFEAEEAQVGEEHHEDDGTSGCDPNAAVFKCDP